MASGNGTTVTSLEARLHPALTGPYYDGSEQAVARQSQVTQLGETTLRYAEMISDLLGNDNPEIRNIAGFFIEHLSVLATRALAKEVQFDPNAPIAPAAQQQLGVIDAQQRGKQLVEDVTFYRDAWSEATPLEREALKDNLAVVARIATGPHDTAGQA